MNQYIVTVKFLPNGKKIRCRERVKRQPKAALKEIRKT
ncbi:nitrogen fixation protein NifZ [Anaeroarcus burkinensis]|nr:nitrogen fixation protein NifZ [Anaeroarcus burkinensis]